MKQVVNAIRALCGFAPAFHPVERRKYPALFICTWAPKGRMSAELTGAQRTSRGRNLPYSIAWTPNDEKYVRDERGSKK